MSDKYFDIEMIITRRIRVQVPEEEIEDGCDPEQFAIDAVNDCWDDCFVADEEDSFIKSIKEVA